MRNRLLVVAVFSVGCAVGGAASSWARDAKAETPPAGVRARWVFSCEQAATGAAAAALLNAKSNDGWELSVTGGENVWCFKKFAVQR
jgi:hypothetical protein